MSTDEILHEILQRVTRVETKLDTHLEASRPIRQMVADHERSLQRVRGAMWLFSMAWAALLAWLGFKR